LGQTDREKNSDALHGTGGGQDPQQRRQQAGFSVFLDQVVEADETHWEARLYHAESGAETTLPGVAPDAWIAWILDRLHPVGAAPPFDGRTSRTAIEVASVELFDVTIVGDDAREGLRTIRAQLVVQLSGVAGLEREIGSRVLQRITEQKRSSTGPSPHAT
jgi:hypothetical protein